MSRKQKVSVEVKIKIIQDYLDGQIGMQEAILALLSISSDISHVHFDSTVMTVNA